MITRKVKKQQMTPTKTREPSKHSHEMSIDEFLDRLETLADDRLFSERHAAALLGRSVKTLQQERFLYNHQRRVDPAAAELLKSKFVPWIAVGRISIRYRLGDLREWIKRMRFGGEVAAPESNIHEVSDGIGYMIL